MALGQLVGVLVAESRRFAAFKSGDEQLLGVVATMLANAIETARGLDLAADADGRAVTAPVSPPRPGPDGAGTHVAEPAMVVRFFDADGSVFLGGEYVVKGVAGRILWSLLGQSRPVPAGRRPTAPARRCRQLTGPRTVPDQARAASTST